MRDALEYSVATQLLALCRFGGVTPRLFEVLFRQYGCPENILRASALSLMDMEGMTWDTANRIASATEQLDEAELFARSLMDRDISVTTCFEKDYPQLLLELNDPPPLLFVRGCLPRKEKRSVAIIGAENATSNGIEVASRLGKRFAQDGVQVISSLSGGVDASAHLGCRSTGVESFAVVDCGFDHLQDADTMPLAIDVVRTGGIISEYLPDQQSNEQTLAEANRLMVGMSQAVVVAEQYVDSIRTRDALSYCCHICKLAFLVIDPELETPFDRESLDYAVRNGAIIIEGYDRIDDIIRSLV